MVTPTLLSWLPFLWTLFINFSPVLIHPDTNFCSIFFFLRKFSEITVFNNRQWKKNSLMTKLFFTFTLTLDSLFSNFQSVNFDLPLTLSSQCSLLIRLKKSEKQRFPDVFRGIKKQHREENGQGNFLNYALIKNPDFIFKTA